MILSPVSLGGTEFRPHDSTRIDSWICRHDDVVQHQQSRGPTVEDCTWRFKERPDFEFRILVNMDDVPLDLHEPVDTENRLRRLKTSSMKDDE
jgi:hypothetical protein